MIRIALLTTLLLAPPAALQAADAPVSPAKPHIDVMLADDMNWHLPQWLKPYLDSLPRSAKSKKRKM